MWPIAIGSIRARDAPRESARRSRRAHWPTSMAPDDRLGELSAQSTTAETLWHRQKLREPGGDERWSGCHRSPAAARPAPLPAASSRAPRHGKRHECLLIAIRRQRTRSCEHLRRRHPPPGIPRPVRLGGHPEHGRERRLRLLQCDPALTQRAGLHDVHTMPSAPGRREARGWRWAYFSQPIFGVDRSLCSPHIRRGNRESGRNWRFLSESGAPGRIRTCDPRLRRPIWRKNTDQRGTKRNRKLGCVPCGSPATLCTRPREGRERSWHAVDCPVTPRTEAETTDSGAAAGHRRHPWPCAWRGGTGWRVRPRRRDRAPWAGGGPDGGRRTPGDRRASRDHRPLMAR